MTNKQIEDSLYKDKYTKIKKDDFSNFEKLEKSILEEDGTILRIIRTHLFIENNINQLLNIYMSKLEVVSKFSFYQKVSILSGMGIFNDKFTNEILIVNKIRNKIAHNQKLTKKMIDEILKQSNIEYKNNLKEYLKYFTGYFSGYISIYRLSPFLGYVLVNKKTYEDDLFFNKYQIVSNAEKFYKDIVEDTLTKLNK